MTANESVSVTPFTVARIFNAPRDVVWKAWTEREALEEWWGPKGCAIEVETLDASPGGTRQPVRSEGATCGGASTVSGTAPRSDTTTAVPMACASTATRPKASGSVEGTVTTEAARKAAGMSWQWPTRWTTPFSPS